ncbi:hypothetical protein GCM10009539_65780 [Cryptosporangium japonicum]|uniref:Uncharacterized protein n=1 Tax=Cryptosporangium japonicum TaxID=80872 RepID=A0ABP3EM24_9ACTN
MADGPAPDKERPGVITAAITLVTTLAVGVIGVRGALRVRDGHRVVTEESGDRGARAKRGGGLAWAPESGAAAEPGGSPHRDGQQAPWPSARSTRNRPPPRGGSAPPEAVPGVAHHRCPRDAPLPAARWPAPGHRVLTRYRLPRLT